MKSWSSIGAASSRVPSLISNPFASPIFSFWAPYRGPGAEMTPRSPSWGARGLPPARWGAPAPQHKQPFIKEGPRKVRPLVAAKGVPGCFWAVEGFLIRVGVGQGVGNRGLSTGRQRRPVGRVSGCPCPDRGAGRRPPVAVRRPGRPKDRPS